MLYATVNFPQFEDNKYIKLNTFHRAFCLAVPIPAGAFNHSRK